MDYYGHSLMVHLVTERFLMVHFVVKHYWIVEKLLLAGYYM
jgi:hypothetical protein